MGNLMVKKEINVSVTAADLKELLREKLNSQGYDFKDPNFQFEVNCPLQGLQGSNTLTNNFNGLISSKGSLVTTNIKLVEMEPRKAEWTLGVKKENS